MSASGKPVSVVRALKMPVAFSIPAYAPERARPAQLRLSVLRYASRSLNPKCAARAQRSAGFVRRSVERRNLKPEMRR